MFLGNCFWYRDDRYQISATTLESAVTKAKAAALQQIAKYKGSQFDELLDICDLHLYEGDTLVHKCTFDFTTMNWEDGRSFWSDVETVLHNDSLNYQNENND